MIYTELYKPESVQELMVGMYVKGISETLIRDIRKQNDSISPAENSKLENVIYGMAQSYVTSAIEEGPMGIIANDVNLKIERSGKKLEDLLNQEEGGVFLDKMIRDSSKRYGEGLEGSEIFMTNYILAADTAKESSLARIYEANPEITRKGQEFIEGTHEAMKYLMKQAGAQQAQMIFGQLPTAYQHLLQSPNNDNSAPAGYSTSSDDKAA
ncbi:MAG: hypothetical protein ACLFPL_02275 [Candidatus Nanoarchaeia archaeon]